MTRLSEKVAVFAGSGTGVGQAINVCGGIVRH